MKKKFGLFFLVFSSVKNLGGQRVRVHRVFRHLMWKLSDRFFGPKESIETKILKNSCFHKDNRFRPIFRSNIGGEKPQETIYTGLQATLTFTVEVIRSFV